MIVRLGVEKFLKTFTGEETGGISPFYVCLLFVPPKFGFKEGFSGISVFYVSCFLGKRKFES